MRITQIMLSSGLGGAERLFVDLCAGLASRGHEVQAICHRRFRGLDELKRPSVTLCPIGVRGWWDALARLRIARAVAEFRPQIVHAHLGRAARLSGSAAHRAGLPAVVTVHNYQNLKYYRAIDHFVVTTSDQGAYLAQAGIGRERITSIPNFSNLAPRPRQWKEPPVRTTFAACGRMVGKKGFDVLLRAVRRLTDLGVDAELLLGGDGPQRSELQALVTALGLQGRVSLIGWVNDVSALLRRADIFVLPSLDEPFGIVVLEAMALDTPIVATRTQGPSEILDADMAYLCEVGDERALAEAMAAAAGDYAGRRRRAAAALERYCGRYSAEAVIPRYEKLYEKLAGEGALSSA